MAKLDTIDVGNQRIGFVEPGQISPRAFGAGVGAAISDLGERAGILGANVAEAQQALLDEAERREKAAQRAAALTSLVTYKGEQGRRLTGLASNLSHTATGFTDGFGKELTAAAEVAIKDLPEELQEEFRARFTEVNQGLLNTAFGAEMRQKGNFTIATADEALNAAVFALKYNKESGEEALGVFAEIIGALDLPASDKELILAKAGRRIAEATMARDEKIRREAERDRAAAVRAAGTALDLDLESRAYRESREGGKFPADLAWRDMPVMGRRLLSVIASGESPGYNVRFGGKTPKTFDDFSRHPNILELIPEGMEEAGKKSTAAGLFQQLYSNWSAAKAALRLPDFGPESQVRAAWWQAQRDYADIAKGDLYKDLMTGNPADYKNIHRVLKDIWPSLKRFTPDQFVAKLLQGVDDASGGDVLSDPTHASLTLQQKLDHLRDNEPRIQAEAALAAERVAAADEAVGQSLVDKIYRGETGWGEAKEWLTEGRFTPKQTKAVLAYYPAEVARLTKINEADTALADSTYLWKDDERDQRLIAAKLPENTVDKLLANDPSALGPETWALIVKTGILPRQIQETLERKLTGGTTADVKFAMGQLMGLDAALPAAVKKKLGDSTYRLFEFYRDRAQFYNPEEFETFIERAIRGGDREGDDKLRDRAKKEIAKGNVVLDLADIADLHDHFTETDILSTVAGRSLDELTTFFGFGQIEDEALIPMGMLDRSVMMDEYQDLYIEAMVLTGGNEGEAKILAGKQLSRRWFPTAAGERIMMTKNPVELSYEPSVYLGDVGPRSVDGSSREWIIEQARLAAGLTVETPVMVVGDGQTGRELNLWRAGKGAMPSYRVLYQTEGGAWEIVQRADGRGMMRMNFERGDTFKELERLTLTREIAFKDLEKLQEEQFLALRELGSTPESRAMTQEKLLAAERAVAAQQKVLTSLDDEMESVHNLYKEDIVRRHGRFIAPTEIEPRLDKRTPSGPGFDRGTTDAISESPRLIGGETPSGPSPGLDVSAPFVEGGPPRSVPGVTPTTPTTPPLAQPEGVDTRAWNALSEEERREWLEALEEVDEEERKEMIRLLNIRPGKGK